MNNEILDLIKKQNTDILEFSPFLDYIHQLQNEGNKFVSSESDSWSQIITFKNRYYKLRIITLKNEYWEWITFCKYKNDDERYDQIEFMVYNEAYQEFYGERDYNRIIKYSAHFDDEEFTRIAYSVCSYQDNELLGGFRELRKFDVQDLGKVKYSKDMNLTELTGIADEKITEFYEVITLKGKEVKELKLGY